MEKVKDDNNLDSHYEDSIFSVTEDVQYPLFDAEKAKAGIVTKDRTSPTKRPQQLTKKASEKSKFQNRDPQFPLDTKVPNITDVFESEIKIDEPLIFGKELKNDVAPFRDQGPFFNNPPFLGLNGVAPPNNGARRIGTHRTPFRPQPLRKEGMNSQAPTNDEPSPRSKMLPGLAAKISTISSGCFSKVIPKVGKVPTNNITNAPQNTKSDKPEKCEKVESKPNVTKPHATKPAEKAHKPVEKKKETPKKAEVDNKASDDRSDTKSKQGLSGRKDVVYKTLLRSVKRYYSGEFESRTEYATLTKSKQEKKCLKIIDRFTRGIFAEYLRTEKGADGQDHETIKGVDFNEVSAFILALIIPSYVKRNLKHTPTYRTYDTFYE